MPPDTSFDLARSVVSGHRFNWNSYGHMIGIALLVLLLADGLPHMVLLMWGLITAVLTLALTQSAEKAWVSGVDVQSSSFIERLKVWNTLIGVCWTIPVALICLYGEEDLLLYAVCVLTGLSLAIAGERHAHPPSSLILVSILMWALLLASLFFEAYLQAAILMLVYVLVFRLTLLLNKMFRNTIALATERDGLLQDLMESASQLQEANLAKSKFLAHASHDLRQPLHAVGLFMESIADHPVDKKVGQVIARVRNSVESLSRLFDSLLDASLLDTGQVEVRIRSMTFADLLQPLQNDFGSVAAAANVELKLVRSRAVVQSDPLILRRIIQNLVTNAIRYADSKVVVGVRRRCTVEGEYTADIQVLDDGPGIRLADQERIFQEFERVEDDRAVAKGVENTAGLGLGLSIVKRLTSLLGLEVEVHTMFGHGSCFAVTGIPILVTDEVAVVAQSPLLGVSFVGARVFVVDDDHQTLDATTALISRWGCEVQASLDGSEVSWTPDLIICDYQLTNGQTGLDVIRSVRERTSSDTPAIIITGKATDEVQTQAKQGEIPVLLKPVQPAKLRSVMLSLLAN